MSIRLHKQHGVNPTIPVCLWCQKDKNELVLLGANYKGKAPMRMVMDYAPCDECIENRKLGIFVAVVTDKQPHDGMAPINPNKGNYVGHVDLYPTGTWCVVKDQALDGLLDDGPMKDQAIKTRGMYIDQEVYDLYFAPAVAQQDKEQSDGSEH
jgi:hypothetical protein